MGVNGFYTSNQDKKKNEEEENKGSRKRYAGIKEQMFTKIKRQK